MEKTRSGELLEAALLAIASMAREKRLPRPLVLKKLVLRSTKTQGPLACAEIEAVIGGAEAVALLIRAERPGARVTGEMVSSGEEARVLVETCVEPGLLRDQVGVTQAASRIREAIVAGLDAASLLLSGKSLEEKTRGEERCLDPGEGISEVLDLLVEAYGPEEGLRVFDEYLEHPGMINVDGVVVYLSEKGPCIAQPE